MVAKGADTIGSRIRKRREELGFSQGQLAEPLLSAAYISLIEAGKRKPSDDALEHISSRLGVTPVELLTGRPPGFEVSLQLELHDARAVLNDGRLEEARKTLSAIMRRARSSDLKQAQAEAEEILGLIAERTEGAEAAKLHFEAAEELWQDEPLHLRFETIAGLSRCARKGGDSQLAVYLLDSYRQDLLKSDMPDPLALMRVHSSLIHSYFAAGLPTKAAEAAREALALENKVNDPNRIACMHLTVARSLQHEGRFEEALTSIQRAREISLAQGWGGQAAKAYLAEAIILSKKEAYDEAHTQLVEALALLEDSPNNLDRALALNELGFVMRHLGDAQAALDYLRQARPLLDDSDILELAFNERELGLCLATIDPTRTETHLRKAVDLYRIASNSTELATTFKALGDFYAQQGKPELALDAMREGLAAVEERST